MLKRLSKWWHFSNRHPISWWQTFYGERRKPCNQAWDLGGPMHARSEIIHFTPGSKLRTERAQHRHEGRCQARQALFMPDRAQLRPGWVDWIIPGPRKLILDPRGHIPDIIGGTTRRPLPLFRTHQERDRSDKGVQLTTSVAPPYHFCPCSPSPWGEGEGAGRPAGAKLPARPTTFPTDFRVNDTRSHSNRVMVTWATMSAYIAANFSKIEYVMFLDIQILTFVPLGSC